MRLPAKTLVVALLLGGSVYLNAILLRAAVHYYRLFNKVSLDPLGLSNYTQRRPLSSVTPRIVFIGDSRAAGWAQPYGADEMQFINRGIGAQTTAQVLGRFEQHVADLEPDIVIIQAGINDLKAIPLFPERADDIIATCQKNLRELTSRSLALGARVIITSIFPAGDTPLQRRPFWPPAVDQGIRKCNESLKSLANDRVTYFDTTSILAGPEGRVKSSYQHDFLHLNNAGYTALNNELMPILRSIAQ